MSNPDRERKYIVNQLLETPGKLVPMVLYKHWITDTNQPCGWVENLFYGELARGKLVEPKVIDGELRWRVTARKRTLAAWISGEYIAPIRQKPARKPVRKRRVPQYDGDPNDKQAIREWRKKNGI